MGEQWNGAWEEKKETKKKDRLGTLALQAQLWEHVHGPQFSLSID
jgi:hypothetical protein